MLELKDAVLTEIFSRMFEQIEERVNATNVKELDAYNPMHIANMGMFIWDEAVAHGLVKEPRKIAPIVDANYSGLYTFLRRELKLEPVTKVYAVSYFNEFSVDLSFVDVALAQCYPEDIHIIDVEFSDNRRPIDNALPIKGHRNYHGLHIFGQFLDQVRAVARSRGARRISLVAAELPLYEVFRRHGFELTHSPIAQMALEAGASIPMSMRV